MTVKSPGVPDTSGVCTFSKVFSQAPTGTHTYTKNYSGKVEELSELSSMGHLYVSLKQSKSHKLLGRGQFTPLIPLLQNHKILRDESNNITGKCVG